MSFFFNIFLPYKSNCHFQLSLEKAQTNFATQRNRINQVKMSIFNKIKIISKKSNLSNILFDKLNNNKANQASLLKRINDYYIPVYEYCNDLLNLWQSYSPEFQSSNSPLIIGLSAPQVCISNIQIIMLAYNIQLNLKIGLWKNYIKRFIAGFVFR